ncbi:MAG: hypothetical protein LBH06_00790 [Rikenellaceae bacterium]|jgi:hypothetical protein|nr:hypothetical protein [Rikenellaceae bacterium]
MKDFIFQLFIERFFLNPRMRPWIKLTGAIVGIFIVVIIVDSSGFFRYTADNKRLTNILTINSILQDSTLTESERTILIEDRSRAISRRNITLRLNRALVDFFSNDFNIFTLSDTARNFADNDSLLVSDTINERYVRVDNINDSLPSSNNTHGNMNVADTVISIMNLINQTHRSPALLSAPDTSLRNVADSSNSSNNNIPMRNKFWFFFFSSFWLILAALAMPISLKDDVNFKESRTSGKIAIVIGSYSLLIGFMFLWNWLFGLALNFPIFGKWWLTYLVMVLSQMALFMALFLLIILFTGKKEKPQSN